MTDSPVRRAPGLGDTCHGEDPTVHPADGRCHANPTGDVQRQHTDECGRHLRTARRAGQLPGRSAAVAGRTSGRAGRLADRHHIVWWQGKPTTPLH